MSRQSDIWVSTDTETETKTKILDILKESWLSWYIKIPLLRLSLHVKTLNQNLGIIVETCWDLLKPVRTCRDMSRLVETCQDLLRPVKNCWDSQPIPRDYCWDLSRLVKTLNQNVSRVSVPTDPNLDQVLVLISRCLKAYA
jgi:hypothetical protein